MASLMRPGSAAKNKFRKIVKLEILTILEELVSLIAGHVLQVRLHRQIDGLLDLELIDLLVVGHLLVRIGLEAIDDVLDSGVDNILVGSAVGHFVPFGGRLSLEPRLGGQLAEQSIILEPVGGVVADHPIHFLGQKPSISLGFV